jgi:hypothetical protein
MTLVDTNEKEKNLDLDLRVVKFAFRSPRQNPSKGPRSTNHRPRPTPPPFDKVIVK